MVSGEGRVGYRQRCRICRVCKSDNRAAAFAAAVGAAAYCKPGDVVGNGQIRKIIIGLPAENSAAVVCRITRIDFRAVVGNGRIVNRQRGKRINRVAQTAAVNAGEISAASAILDGDAADS